MLQDLHTASDRSDAAAHQEVVGVVGTGLATVQLAARLALDLRQEAVVVHPDAVHTLQVAITGRQVNGCQTQCRLQA